MRSFTKINMYIFLLSFVFLLFPAIAIAASPGAALPPPPSQIEIISPFSTQYLIAWNCNIVNNLDGSVTLSGYSQANQSVDQIWVSFYLQRWNGSQWVNAAGGYKTTEYGSDFVNAQKWLSVNKGYYYRAMAQHQAINRGVYDPVPPATSTSSYVLVE